MEALIYEESAPHTAAFFLSYADEGYYNGAGFYRSCVEGNQPANIVKINIIEGGFYNDYYEQALKECLRGGFDDEKGHRGPKPMISVETTLTTGLAHVDGTLSLGRSSKDTVGDSFFICVGDQPGLDYGGARHPDGLGFSAFGKVVSGMDIVQAINNSEIAGQKLRNDVRILSIARKNHDEK
jgi:peptidyl-prolyl cis-trans isomerase A (cyclophilin A)